MIENTFGMNIIPENDAERLVALKRYRIMDTPAEDSFNNIARLCTEIFNVPISLVSLVDADRVFFKANVGMGKAKEANRGKSLCALAVLDPEVTVFEDALKVPCLIANPNVAGDFGLRFYAGAPLVTHDGFLIGTLCIIDQQPREFSKKEELILAGMAQTIMDQIELRLSALKEIDSQQKANIILNEQQEEAQVLNEELTATNEELRMSQEELMLFNEKLTESEARFRNLVNKAPVAIAIYTGPDLIIEQANEQILKIWGRGTEVIGMPLLDARPEIRDHPYMKILANVFSTGHEHTGFGIKGPVLYDGEVKEGYFDAVYRPILDNTGKVVSIMLVATDVTDRTLIRIREKEMTEELSVINEELRASNEELIASQEHLVELNASLTASEFQFRSLVLQAPVSICIISAKDLMIEVVNDHYLELVGRNREGFEHQTIWDAVPEVADIYSPIMQEVIDTAIPFYAEEHDVVLTRKGIPEQVIIDFVYAPIKYSEGKVGALMVVGIDVTEKVLAKRRTEEIEERVRLAIEAAEIGTYDLDLTKPYLLTSDRFNAIFGFSRPAEWADYLALIHPEDQVIRFEAHQEAMKSGKLFYEVRIIHPDGSPRWIRITGQFYFTDEKLVRILGTLLDITEVKHLQQQKDDFLSIASHELKTPVTSLRASLQLLHRMKDKPFTPVHTKLIDQSYRSMNKLSDLINDLLNINRLSDGQLYLEKTEFTIADMLNACCNHIRMAGQHDLILTGDLTLRIHADEHRIDQVVVNLVNNAVKYAPKSREIFLSVEKTEGFAKISVRDTGEGVPEEKLPYLFDRYYRADHSGTAYTGLGLGLYISAEIVRKHGGEVGVESELGKGSTFWFTLPL